MDLLTTFLSWRAIKSMPGVASWVEKRINKHTRRRIMRDLNTIAFWGEGFLGPITKIAAGDGEDGDCKTIRTSLEKTSKDVEEAAHRLEWAKLHYISEELGNFVSRAVGDIVHKKTGSGGIREKIDLLSKACERDPKTPHVQREAKLILGEISKLNRTVDKAHEQIRLKQAAKAKRKKAPAKTKSKAGKR